MKMTTAGELDAVEIMAAQVRDRVEMVAKIVVRYLCGALLYWWSLRVLVSSTASKSTSAIAS
jgi:hypothetical protein